MASKNSNALNCNIIYGNNEMDWNDYRPKDDAIQIKWIFYDAGGWNSDPENVLQCRQVVRLRNLLNVVEIAVDSK